MEKRTAEWKIAGGRTVATLLECADGSWKYRADGAGGTFYGSREEALAWAERRTIAEGFRSIVRIESDPK